MASPTPIAPVGFGADRCGPPSNAQEPTAITAAALPQTRLAISRAERPPIVQYAGVGGGNRAFHHRQVLAGLLAHHAFQNAFGLLAGRRHDGLVIFPGEKREHQLRDRRMAGSQHRLRVAGAILQLQPYQDRPALLFQGCRNLCGRAQGQTQHRCHRTAKLQELSAWDSIAPQGVCNARIRDQAWVSPTRCPAARRPTGLLRSHRDERAIWVPFRAPNNAPL